MSVKVTQIEGMKLKAEYEGLEVVSGRVDENTQPEGMSPGKLTAASLGLCTGMHVAGYLKRHSVPNEGFEITVDQVNAENPRRCGGFTTTIHVKAELADGQREALLAEANKCYVGNTLRRGATVNVTLKSEP
jgi:putative redox protein